MSAGHTYLCASNFRRQPPTTQSEDSFLPPTAGRAWDIGSSSEIFVCDPMCIEVSKLDAKEFVGFLTLYVYVVAPGEIFREIQSKIFEL